MRRRKSASLQAASSFAALSVRLPVIRSPFAWWEDPSGDEPDRTLRLADTNLTSQLGVGVAQKKTAARRRGYRRAAVHARALGFVAGAACAGKRRRGRIGRAVACCGHQANAVKRKPGRVGRRRRLGEGAVACCGHPLPGRASSGACGRSRARRRRPPRTSAAGRAR